MATTPWKRELVQAPDDVLAVALELGIDEARALRLAEAARSHRFRTTRSYLALVDPSDPRDPILAQLLPDERELLPSPPGYAHDAVGDVLPAHHVAPGLVHKYEGRALLVTTSACAVYCRFCFRRAYPYEELRDGGAGLAEARAVIAADPSIHEVILSGGDPLSWSDGAFARLLHDLAAIPHLRRVRVHSRMPVVLPSRITAELVAALRGCRLQAWFVTHFNHPRELTPEALAACARLSDAGIPVLNQAVLLRGVNDDADVLAALCEGLVDHGIKPYYLHQLDRVHGVAHFEVPEDEARTLVEALRARVSGIAMPAWVRDVPGALSKTPLLLLLLLLGCGGKPEEPPRVERSLAGVEARPAPVIEARPAPVIEVEDIDAEGFPNAERVLVADLDGDGNPEVFVAEGSEVRWGTFVPGVEHPAFDKRHRGSGMLQAWTVLDSDGDGDDEVAMAFGLGRGFADADAEVVLLADVTGGTVAAPIWRSKGERSQVTALSPWPRDGGGDDLYLAHFETRFSVRGGVLDTQVRAEPRWLPGHTVRMGMARAVGDFDADGRQEVAIGRLYGESADEDGDLRVVDDDGKVFMIPTSRGVRAVGVSDLDQDGRDELLFGDGWHKNYGKFARFRPNIAAWDAARVWTVVNLDERSTDFTVESLGAAGGAVIAGGNASLSVYSWAPAGGWAARGAPIPVASSGSFAVLGGDLIVSGNPIRRVPLLNVPTHEEQQGEAQQQR